MMRREERSRAHHRGNGPRGWRRSYIAPTMLESSKALHQNVWLCRGVIETMQLQAGVVKRQS